MLNRAASGILGAFFGILVLIGKVLNPMAIYGKVKAGLHHDEST
jgi:hypothetical protein